MNKHLCSSAGPTPLSSRPETVKIRERYSTQKIISKTLSQELGQANIILNWIASRQNLSIKFEDGYYTVNADGKTYIGYDLRTVILDLASK